MREKEIQTATGKFRASRRIFPQPAKGPSFDCAKATMDIEKAICGNEELSGLDELLAKAYRERLGMIDALVDRLKRGQPRTILEKT